MEFGMWNIGWIIKKRAFLNANKTALIYEDRAIAYKQLNDDVNRLAGFFREKDLKKGDRVALLLRNCPEFFLVFFAAAKLGLIAVPINSRLAAPELLFQLNNCGARLLVFHEDYSEAVESIRSRLKMNRDQFISVQDGNSHATWALDFNTILQGYSPAEPELPYDVHLDDPLAIIYTSGVTGYPKGALLTHQQTVFKCFQVILYVDMRERDVYLSQLPLFHSGGLFCAGLPAFCRGATLVMRERFDPAKFVEDIRKYHCTVIFALTAMWKLIMQTGMLKAQDVVSVRVVLGGGEKTPLNMFDELMENGIEMQQVYGQTEHSLMMVLPKDEIKRKKGSIGLPGFFTEAWIQDKEGVKLAPGNIGEIVAKGPNVMSGYWGMPEITAQTIVDGVLHTGDLGYMDEEGFFYMVDRATDAYRSGGENVYPAEVEKVLLCHPGISQVAIIGIPDEKWGETGKAFISLKDGEELFEKEIAEYLKDKVAKYKIPKYFEFIPDIPMTASGKINKSELRKRTQEPREKT